ncbi:SulP family inorganic anion transporter [Lewinella cohaerens]|uniref:SulP family inorganic anion transporter n=1 Tax=Lewinella cohaerens TaxID=70995 RepID=UPI00037AFD81|nr:SulP family inorganic anion transporter [Lewinella cohaerens]
MKSQEPGLFSELKSDLPAGLVVFLVAVPLCLGIALASGAPLFSGIIAGIVGGTVVALLSGSPLGVSGPAAGLAVIVLTAIQTLGYEAFLLSVAIAGIIQIVLGFAKAGVIGYFFPSSVIKGMLSGIGLIIILKQIPHAFGYDSDPEGDFAFKQIDGETTFSALEHMLDAITPGALLISVLSLGILILWQQPFIKKFKITNIIQGPLVVVAVGIILQQVLMGTSWNLEPEHLVTLPIANGWGEFIGLFTLPDFSQWSNPAIWVTAITIAIVASLETLLCVEATDKLDPYKRLTPTNLELKAQGVGNLISGLIGGLPVTQVIVRSSANIQSGGKTKAAAFIHGLMLLGSVLVIPKLLNMIPLASLAAILIVVGFKLAKPSLFKEMARLGNKQLVPFVVTIVAILFTDLLVGIGIGMVVAIFYILLNNYKTPYFVEDKRKDAGIIHLELAEDVSFLNKASMLLSLKKLPRNSKVVIDATQTLHIDYDIKEIIMEYKANAAYKNIDLSFIGLNPETMDLESSSRKQKAGARIPVEPVD